MSYQTIFAEARAELQGYTSLFAELAQARTFLALAVKQQDTSAMLQFLTLIRNLCNSISTASLKVSDHLPATMILDLVADKLKNDFADLTDGLPNYLERLAKWQDAMGAEFPTRFTTTDQSLSLANEIAVARDLQQTSDAKTWAVVTDELRKLTDVDHTLQQRMTDRKPKTVALELALFIFDTFAEHFPEIELDALAHSFCRQLLNTREYRLTG